MAALLFAVQLLMPFSVIVQAEETNVKHNDESNVATRETAETANLEGNAEQAVSLQSNGAAVDFFAAVDGEWEKVGSIADPCGPEKIAGSSRYYLTAEQLESVYAPFGFSAADFGGERTFPHTDDYNRDTIWADAAPVGTGSNAKIPVSFRSKSYVYYLPNNVEGEEEYFTVNKSITDAQMLNRNMFYSVSFEDNVGAFDAVPDTLYLTPIESKTITLPYSEEYSWKCIKAKTGEEVQMDYQVSESGTTATVLLQSLEEPIIFETASDKILISYSPSVKESMIKVGQFESSMQEITNDATIKGQEQYIENCDDGNYTVLTPDVTKIQVSLPSNTSSGATLFYKFSGWKVGDADIILQPGAVLSKEEIKKYLPDDKIIRLHAVWTAKDENNRAISLNFYVNKDCEIMDSMSNGFASQHPNLFSSAVFATTISNGDNVPKTTNGSIQLLAPPTTEDTAYDVDTELRTASNNSLPYGVEIESFPSDEEVLAKLRKEQSTQKNKISLNGEVVKEEDITTDNFTVRWYVLKYEKADGWHVDGVLVAKHAKIVVQKTFAGDNEAIEEIENGDFNITVQHSSDNTEVTDYTLTLSQASSDTSTGYTHYDTETKTYSWVLPVAQGVTYTIKEHAYTPEDTDRWHTDIRCGVAKSGSTEWKKYDSDDGISVTAEAYPDDVPEDAYAKVRLENTYVKAGTLRIHKADGYTGNGIQGVSFILTRADDSFLAVYKKYRTSEYSTAANAQELGYTEAVSKNILTTDTNGNIYVSLEVDTNETLSGEYYLEEIAPEGYMKIPKLLIKVTDNGVIEFAHSAVDGSDIAGIVEGANTSTLTIKNSCAYNATVIAEKIWADNIADKVPVKFELWLNGQKLDGCTRTISSTDNWQTTWENMPLYVDGKAASYQIRETKIGDTYADSNGEFIDYTVIYAAPAYQEGTSEEHSEPVWVQNNETLHADRMVLRVENAAKKELAQVAVSKHVQGSMGDKERPFAFTAYVVKDEEMQDFTINGTNYFGKQEFKLKDSETAVISLPLNATLYITEAPCDGYKTTYSIDEGEYRQGRNAEIQASATTSSVAFYNEKDAIPDVGVKDESNWPHYIVMAIAVLSATLWVYTSKKRGDKDD